MEMAFLLINGLMMFYIGKRLMPKRWAFIPAFILILFPGPWYKVFFTFGILLPLLALIRFLEEKTHLKIIMVGWSIGTAFIFKFESGLCSFLMVSSVLFLSSIRENGNFHINRRTFIGFLKYFLVCSLALLSVLFPFILYYQSKSALAGFFSSLKGSYSISNIKGIDDFFDEPSILKAIIKFHIGDLHHQFFFFIILLYLYVLRKIVMHLFVEKRRSFPILFPILIAGILSLGYAYVSFSKTYLLQSGAVAYILFGVVLYTIRQKQTVKSNVVFLVLILLLILYVMDNFNWRARFSGSIKTLYLIKREGGQQISSNKAKVYVGRRKLDTIHGLLHFFEGKNDYLLPLYYDPMVNFLTGLENPTRYSILFPPLFKTLFSEEQVIYDVDRYKIKYLLVRRSLWTSQESSGLRSYAPMLYEFVTTRYQFEKEIGNYFIFSRR
jgi:hypothetical protein